MKDDQVSFKEALRLNSRTLSMIYHHHPAMIVSGLANVAWSAVAPYVGIYLSALVVEELHASRDPERLKWLVLLTLASAALIALVGAIISRWAEIQNAGENQKRWEIIMKKMMDMDFVDADNTATRELLDKLFEQRNSGGWGIDRVAYDCQKLLSACVTIAGGLALTVSLFTSKVPDDSGVFTVLNHPLFLAGMILVMIAVICLSPLFSARADAYFVQRIDEQIMRERMVGFYVNLSRSHSTAGDMRMYGQEKFLEKHHRDSKSTVYGSQGLFAQFAKGPMGVYRMAAAASSVVFVGLAYAFVGLKAWGGAFGPGAVTQYVGALTRVAGGVTVLISFLGTMRTNAFYVAQWFEFLDIPNKMYQGSLSVEKRTDYDYDVEFRNVSFKYPGSDNYVLKNINMKFQISKRLAVVGMNGSGKTTFIKLLCRLYDPTEGEILLNGIDIRKYNYKEYMDIFSIVFQDFRLPSLKLGENVGSGIGYDEQLVRESLEKAGMAGRVQEMPDGLDTYLNRDFEDCGINLSGGEAQKVAIARALYKSSPFLILDEPTAALDPVAEAEIYNQLNDIVGEKTAIYISHRLSSCKFCDEIVVFHEGQVVQQGSHEALVADRDGKYFELWNAQAQYYA